MIAQSTASKPMTTRLNRMVDRAVALIMDDNPEFTRAQAVEIAMQLPEVQRLYEQDRASNGVFTGVPGVESGDTGGVDRYG